MTVTPSLVRSMEYILTKAVRTATTLTTDGNGNTNTVELRAGTYYVKETKVPKGFQLDKTVHTFTVKAGEITTLKVSDTPKLQTRRLSFSSWIWILQKVRRKATLP